jgi:hypothetical protein
MRSRLALLIAALIVLSATAFAQPHTVLGPIDPARYAGEIRALAEAIRQAEAGAVAEIERRVPAVWKVQVGERVVDVPGGWVQQRLRVSQAAPQQWTAVRSQLLEALAIAEREAQSLHAEAGALDANRARGSLDAVLARPEFAQMARETAMTRLQNRVLEWLRRWWTRLGGDRLAVRSTATVFAWIASVAALLVLASWLIHTLRHSKRLPLTLPEEPHGRRMSARAWAERAVAAEDLREAARCAYRAVVSRLEEDGIWRIDEARTPREYLGLLPRGHARRPMLEDVARRFEEIWFGGRPGTADDRGSLLRQLKELGCLPAE